MANRVLAVLVLGLGSHGDAAARPTKCTHEGGSREGGGKGGGKTERNREREREIQRQMEDGRGTRGCLNDIQYMVYGIY